MAGSGYLEWDPALDSRRTTRLKLHEFYLATESEHVNFSVGSKLVNWSFADGRGALNLINPNDLRDPLSSARDTSRLPVTMADLELKSTFGLFNLVSLPRAAVDKLQEAGNGWEPLSLAQLRARADAGEISLHESAAPATPEWGMRWLYYTEGVDYSLVYYNGLRDTPLLAQDGAGSGIRFEYPRQSTLGGSVATNFTASTLRAELAVVPDYRVIDAQGRRRTRTLNNSVVGWDHTFDSETYLNIQLYWYHLSGAAALDTPRDEYGITWSVSQPFFSSDLTLGVRGQWAMDDASAVTELYGKYLFGDKLKLGAGVMLFDGPSDSSYGMYRHNDLVYLKAKWRW